MSEQTNINLNDIQSVPPTRIEYNSPQIRTMGGEYISPSSSENSEGIHIIRIEDLSPESKTVKAISRVATLFKENSQNTEFLVMLTADEKEKVAARIEKIGERIVNDSEYRDNYAKLLHSHEGVHRMREVRLGTEQMLAKSEEQIKAIWEEDLGKESEERREEYLKSVVSIAIYDETEATIAGLRNAIEVDSEVRSDLLFLGAAITFGEMAKIRGERNYSTNIEFAYEATKNGTIPMFSPVYELSTIMVGLGDGNLVRDITDGKVSKDDFKSKADSAIKVILINPEKILNNVDTDNDLIRSVDANLINSVERTKQILKDSEPAN